MCYYPRMRFPVDGLFLDSHILKSGGYNAASKCFIVDLRNKDRIEYLCTFLPKFGFDLDSSEQIPCGMCEECRLDYAKEWAQRCMAEATLWKHNYFVTLTYDDEHLAECYDFTISRRTGEPGVFPCLVKDHLEKFKKDLRAYMKYHFNMDNIRTYECGEYGSKNGRPHFHILLYNCELPDLQVLKTYDVKGKTVTYCTSEIIEKTWSRGFITIGEVTWDSCSYVARYMLKKLIGKHNDQYLEACKNAGVTPQLNEFTNGSRRPGIGRAYYDMHKDSIYSVDKDVLTAGHVVKPCKYFDNLYDLENPGLLSELKMQRRKLGLLLQAQKMKGVSDIEAYHKRHIEISQRKLKKLVRTV